MYEWSRSELIAFPIKRSGNSKQTSEPNHSKMVWEPEELLGFDKIEPKKHAHTSGLVGTE